MFSLLLAAAASLTPAFNDASYGDLGHVNPGPAGECVARFAAGSLEIRQAYNEPAGTMINVAVISGKPTRALPVGSRLWVKASFGPAWRALVTQSSPQRIEVVAHSRFAGDLFVEDSLTILLHERIEAGSIADAVIVDVGDGGDFRQQLAGALDCADALGI